MLVDFFFFFFFADVILDRQLQHLSPPPPPPLFLYSCIPVHWSLTTTDLSQVSQSINYLDHVYREKITYVIVLIYDLGHNIFNHGRLCHATANCDGCIFMHNTSLSHTVYCHFWHIYFLVCFFFFFHWSLSNFFTTLKLFIIWNVSAWIKSDNPKWTASFCFDMTHSDWQ